MKAIPKLDLTALGYIIMAGVLGTVATSGYALLSAPTGSAVFPVSNAALPQTGAFEKMANTIRLGLREWG